MAFNPERSRRIAEIEEHERKRRKREREVHQNRLALERLRNQIAHRRAQSWQPDPRLEGVKSLGTGGLALFQGQNTCG